MTNNAIDYINDPDPKKLAHKIRSSMNNVIYCLNAAENMKRRDLGYPRTETYTAANGKKCTLNPPRLRLDELHFRAILGIMSTKDGPATFKEIAAERKFKGDDILSLSFRFGMQYPAIVEEVAACETPAAARAAIRRHEAEIAARLQLQADLEEVRAELPARAAAMIAKATGMTVEHVAKRLNADRLMLKAGDFRDSILSGKVEGADKPGFDLRAAFQGVLDKFVKGRLALMDEVDKIADISDDLKRKWKKHIISTYKAEALNPSKIHKLLACGHFSDKLLVEALETNGTAPAAEKICTYMGGVNAHFVELFGEDEWEDMGDDERDPVLNMALMGVIDKNPAVPRSSSSARTS